MVVRGLLRPTTTNLCRKLALLAAAVAIGLSLPLAASLHQQRHGHSQSFKSLVDKVDLKGCFPF